MDLQIDVCIRVVSPNPQIQFMEFEERHVFPFRNSFYVKITESMLFFTIILKENRLKGSVRLGRNSV